jgi:hypothetical protein
MFDAVNRQRQPIDPRVWFWCGGSLIAIMGVAFIVQGIQGAERWWTMPLGPLWLAIGFEHRRRNGVKPGLSLALASASVVLAVAAFAWLVYRSSLR